MDENSKAVKIVKSLINLVGVTAGIILASIGAIMFLSAIFNLYVFNIKSPEYSYGDYYKCDIFDVDRIEASILLGSNNSPEIALKAPTNKVQKEKVSQLTEEQKKKLREKYKECVEKLKKDNEEKFKTSEKRHIATGLSFMIVGFPLIFFYQRKKKVAE